MTNRIRIVYHGSLARWHEKLARGYSENRKLASTIEEYFQARKKAEKHAIKAQKHLEELYDIAEDKDLVKRMVEMQIIRISS